MKKQDRANELLAWYEEHRRASAAKHHVEQAIMSMKMAESELSYVPRSVMPAWCNDVTSNARQIYRDLELYRDRVDAVVKTLDPYTRTKPGKRKTSR